MSGTTIMIIGGAIDIIFLLIGIIAAVYFRNKKRDIEREIDKEYEIR